MTVLGQVQPAARRLDTVIVCHQEYLVAAAAAAVLEQRGAARSVTTVPSLTRLLSTLHRGVDVAVVFDGVGEDTVELFEALHHRGLATPVLIVSDRPTPEQAARALECGAAGLLQSSCSPDALCQAVLDTRRGTAVLPHAMRAAVLEAMRVRRLRYYAAQRRLAELSPAERHVLRALADGVSVTRIADGMALSPHTVRSHVRALGTKLGTRGQLRIAASGRDLLSATRRTGWDLTPVPRGEEGA